MGTSHSVKVTSESLQDVSDIDQMNTPHLLCRAASFPADIKKKREKL